MLSGVLDVYKRQDLVSPIIGERFGSGLRGDLVVDGRHQRGWKAVSYTHLDVYKRQLYNLSVT